MFRENYIFWFAVVELQIGTGAREGLALSLALQRVEAGRGAEFDLAVVPGLVLRAYGHTLENFSLLQFFQGQGLEFLLGVLLRELLGRFDNPMGFLRLDDIVGSRARQHALLGVSPFIPPAFLRKRLLRR